MLSLPSLLETLTHNSTKIPDIECVEGTRWLKQHPLNRYLFPCQLKQSNAVGLRYRIKETHTYCLQQQQDKISVIYNSSGHHKLWCYSLEPWWCINRLLRIFLLLCSRSSALRFSIRYTQKTSVHKWSSQASTVKHPTAARRHGKLDI
jgi:hypothetical protein